MSEYGLEIIEKRLKEKLVNELTRTGLLFRLFSRVKEQTSIDEKFFIGWAMRAGQKAATRLVIITSETRASSTKPLCGNGQDNCTLAYCSPVPNFRSGQRDSSSHACVYIDVTSQEVSHVSDVLWWTLVMDILGNGHPGRSCPKPWTQ